MRSSTRLARNSCTIPIAAFATMTKPNSASAYRRIARTATSSAMRTASKSVKTLSRTITQTLRLAVSVK
jgi:hypothetical protein